MVSLIREKVSQNKVRYKAYGFNLDLTYITDRIIAMGYPSDTMDKYYRNPIEEVKRFFELMHKDHYKLYNLCSERNYDQAHFQNRVAVYPFDDHNAPPVPLIVQFVADAEAFLNEHPDNVVAIHCKAGKGRTGIMTSCLLIHLGTPHGLEHIQSAAEALAFFGEQRTSDGHAVMIPSQIRYVHYFEKVWKAGGMPPPRPLILSHVRMFTIPSFDIGGGCDPYLIVTNSKGSFKTAPLQHLKKEETVDIDLNVLVDDHSKVVLMDYDHASADDYMCHFWITPEFVDDSLTLTLTKDELDGAVKDTKNVHFKPEFQLQLFFKLPETQS